MLHKCCFWVKTHFEKLYMDLCFLKSVVLWPYYILLYKNASYLVLHLGKCMDCWHGKYEHLWLNPMKRNSWTLWYIGNLKVLIYFVLYHLGNIDAKHFWREILLRILWIFGCCNTLRNYLEVNYIFWIHWTCELLMWGPCAMMLVITLFWWQQAKLETHTLHDTSKSLSVWVRPLPLGLKDHMQKGYCATWGEKVNPWVCRWARQGQETTCKRGITWRVISCCPWRG